MCMGACTYCRIKGVKNCIPEKYSLDKYIARLYDEAVKESAEGTGSFDMDTILK